MAAEMYNSLLELLPQQRVEIQSVIGRMYLQLGDLKSAQMYFSRVIKSCDSQEQENSQHQTIVKINE
jgi:tetratricopeptide (TPR) repeat protein